MACFTANGRDLTITVTRPGRTSNLIVLIVVFAPMAYAIVMGFVPGMLRSSSLLEFVGRSLPMLIFDSVCLFLFRGLVESKCADQVVAADDRGVTWLRKARLWTRKRHLDAAKITDISGAVSWDGFGRVYVTAGWRRHAVLEGILGADALKYADDLKKAVGGR